MIQVKKLYKCQKAIIIHKERITSEVKFSAIKTDVLAASRDLNESAYKIYIYLISNQEGYAFGLSRQDVVNQTGISSKSYDRGVAQLIEKGYLLYTGDYATDGVEQAPLYKFISNPTPSQFGYSD